MSKNEIRIKEIPKGSRLESYLAAFPDIKVVTNDFDILYRYLSKLFEDCIEFVMRETDFEQPYSWHLKLIPTTDEYNRLEKEAEKRGIVEEQAKTQSHAFCLENKFRAEIVVNLEYFVGLWRHGSLTILMNIAGTFIHEILHVRLRGKQKEEQDVFDLEHELREKFLEIKLPKNTKKVKASEYYYKISRSFL